MAAVVSAVVSATAAAGFLTLTVAQAQAQDQAPAQAQGQEPSLSACAGVRVVVDPGPLGGGIARRCVEEDGDRSAAALTEQAGVAVTWVQRYPGFVCRLAGRPSDLRCAETPPSDGYWGLFWAGPGDSVWTYSTQGAGSLTVPRGGAVGWRFQDGGRRDDPAALLDQEPGLDSPPAAVPASQTSMLRSDEGTGSAALLLGAAGLAAAMLAGYGVVVARRRRL